MAPKFKLYIDSTTSKPDQPGWLQIKSLNDLVNIFSTVHVDDISFIYVGKGVDPEQHSIMETDMNDIALAIIEYWKGRPLPEITVLKTDDHGIYPAGMFKTYSQGYNHKNKCTEVE